MIGLYRNNMESTGLQAQIVNFAGERCQRGGSGHAFRIFVGKQTKECAYRTPVIGRDLEVAAIGRVLQGTPKPVQHKAFLALNLRAGGAGARYQLAVFPLQHKAQLLPLHGRRARSSTSASRARSARRGSTGRTNCACAPSTSPAAPKRASCRVQAWVGKQLVADFTDPASGELQGRTAGFSLGAAGNAKGTLGSFDDVVVRVPSPY